MNKHTLIPHLFRTEFSKIVAVLCKKFGLSSIQIAEDIVSDTFLLATETWAFKGIPENPAAWLYKVASNRTKDYLKRDLLFQNKVKPELRRSDSYANSFEIDLSERSISDSQLQMLFAVCDNIISKQAQIALALRILCGFGIDEIASAFLSSRETINKRLHRAKKTLRKNNIPVCFPPEGELHKRLDNVLLIIYLLFNEGYCSLSGNTPLRKDLCLEALHLAYLLHNNTSTNTPKVNALIALICFHVSRFEARIDVDGQPVLYGEQEVEKWDHELIKKGIFFLGLSARGETLSKYHLEAGISFWHTKNKDTPEKWKNILQFYNQLLQIEYSPIAALNRAYAYSKVYGKEKAIHEAQKTALEGHHLYHHLLAELFDGINTNKRKENLHRALDIANSENEKIFIRNKLNGM